MLLVQISYMMQPFFKYVQYYYNFRSYAIYMTLMFWIQLIFFRIGIELYKWFCVLEGARLRFLFFFFTLLSIEYKGHFNKVMFSTSDLFIMVSGDLEIKYYSISYYYQSTNKGIARSIIVISTTILHLMFQLILVIERLLQIILM